MAKEAISKLKRLQTEVRAFWEEQAVRSETQPSKLRKFAHFWVLVCRSFVRNRCPVRASALAYYTLLALIPMLAVGIGVSASLLKKDGTQPIQKMIDRLVAEVAPQLGLLPETSTTEQIDARREVNERIQTFIANVHSGTLGLTGTIGLVFVAIGLLSTIEASFNDIWGVTRGRSWFARLIHYWAAITLGPLLILLAMGLTIGSQFQAVQNMIRTTPFVGNLVFEISPFVILVIIFMLFYQFMPNTCVRWKAALIGALVGGALWMLNSHFNVTFASRVISASKIYGPLGVVPVFLIGLYFSWLILLFGAQVSYAVQNLEAYLQEKQSETVNQRGREFIALRLMAIVGQRFHHTQPPPSAQQMADELSVPARLLLRIVQVLLSAGLLVEVAGTETTYTPARPLEKITCHDILLALRTGNGQELPTRDGPMRVAVCGEFEKIQAAECHAAGVTLLALVSSASAVREEKPED